jgi:hypothetical protein
VTSPFAVDSINVVENYHKKIVAGKKKKKTKSRLALICGFIQC